MTETDEWVGYLVGTTVVFIVVLLILAVVLFIIACDDNDGFVFEIMIAIFCFGSVIIVVNIVPQHYSSYTGNVQIIDYPYAYLEDIDKVVEIDTDYRSDEPFVARLSCYEGRDTYICSVKAWEVDF